MRMPTAAANNWQPAAHNYILTMLCAHLYTNIAGLAQRKLGTLQVDAHVQHGSQEALVDLPLDPPALAGCACGLHLLQIPGVSSARTWQHPRADEGIEAAPMRE